MNNWGIQEESTYLGVQCITMSNEMMGNVRWKMYDGRWQRGNGSPRLRLVGAGKGQTAEVKVRQ